MKKTTFTSVILLLLLTSLLTAQVSQKSRVEKLVDNYIENLLSGEYNQASTAWNDNYLQSVYKFGIWYDDMLCKFDCNSPLMPYLDDLKSGKFQYSIKVFSTALNFYQIILTVEGENLKDEIDYYRAQRFGTVWFLVPNYWPDYMVMQKVESKYLAVYHFNENQINDSALAIADQLIEKISTRLGMQESDFERLEADKITYLLCQTLSQFKELTHISEPGWHDPANNFLISTNLPHGRILAEFLVTYHLGEKSRHTLPLLEKGLTVALGDRAGTALENFYQLIAYSLQEEFLKPEDLLTVQDFTNKTGGPDFAYTLAGFFFRYLETEIEMSRLLELYKSLSRGQVELESLTADGIKDIIKDVTGQKWSNLEKGFKKYFENIFQKTVYPVDSIPKGDVVFQSGTPNFSLTISEFENWYYVESHAFNKLTPVSLAVLIKPVQPQQQNTYQSTLFPKLLGFRDYAKEFYGIVFNTQEIGIYNYQTNEITGKYITAMDFEEKKTDDGRVRFKFCKDLLTAEFSDFVIELVEMP